MSASPKHWQSISELAEFLAENRLTGRGDNRISGRGLELLQELSKAAYRESFFHKGGSELTAAQMAQLRPLAETREPGDTREAVQTLLSPLICACCVERPAYVWEIDVDGEYAEGAVAGTLVRADRFRCFSIMPLCQRCADESAAEEGDDGGGADLWMVEVLPVQLNRWGKTAAGVG